MASLALDLDTAGEPGATAGADAGEGVDYGDYTTVYMVRDTEDVPKPEVPSLHEIWTWEGDELVLPGKWSTVIRKSFGAFAKDKTPSWFLEHYAKKPQFEPQGVFFITKRSDVLGTCFAWNDGGESAKTIGQLHWLGVAPDHRGRGIAKCLIRLVLGYHKRMGRTQVWLSTESFRKDAIALYEREGFRVVDAPPKADDTGGDGADGKEADA